jgi:hypothetical protein
MISASQKYEESAYFCVGVDDDAIPHGYIRDDGSTKLSAIAINAGVDGIENPCVQNCSLRQGIQGICVRMTKPGLHVKRQNRSHRDSKWLNTGVWNLGWSGEDTCGRQEEGKKTWHDWAFPLRERLPKFHLKFAGAYGQREIDPDALNQLSIPLGAARGEAKPALYTRSMRLYTAPRLEPSHMLAWMDSGRGGWSLETIPTTSHPGSWGQNGNVSPL